MKPGIKEFDAFLTDTFVKQIRTDYEELKILSEADLQARAWLLIRDFLRPYDPTEKKLRVLNKLYLRRLGIHPDLAILRRKKPWVLIELKERRKLTTRSAKKERNRLLKAKKHLHPRPKRGYLVWVARWGNSKVLTGPKGPGAKFFFEVPIVLRETRTAEYVSKWEREFSMWAKYVEKI